MAIYFIERDDAAGYDEAQSMVVRSRNETTAREFAAKNSGDEGQDVWLSGFVTVENLGISNDGDADRLICRDYHEA